MRNRHFQWYKLAAKRALRGVTLIVALNSIHLATPAFARLRGNVLSENQLQAKRSSPALIEQAYTHGEIDVNQWALYHAYGIFDPSKLPEQYRSTEREKCGTWILNEIRRHWQELAQDTRDKMMRMGFTTAGTLSRPAGLDSTRSTAHFVIHYSVVPGDTNAVSTYDGDANGTPDYIDTVASIIEYVWNYEISTMGYTAPPPDSGYGGDDRYDVYIFNFNPDLYGYAESELRVGDNPNSSGVTETNAYTSFLALRNSYAYFSPSGSSAIQVTTAHEFYHAIQMGYDADESVWMMEATATWSEDEVYDAVNDNYQYLPSWFASPEVPLDAGRGSIDTSYHDPEHWYGSWIFFRYLSEHVGGRTTVRQILEHTLAYNNSQADSSFREISDAIVANNTTFTQVFRNFTTANLVLTIRPYNYREGGNYPVIKSTLFQEDTTFSSPLPRHASSYFQVPPEMLPDCKKHLTVTFTQLDLSAVQGVQMIVYGGGSITQIPFQSRLTLTGDLPIDSLFVIVLNFGTTGTTGNYAILARTQIRETQYTIIDLGMPVNISARLNNQGQIAVTSFMINGAGGSYYAYEWNNGGLQLLGPQAGANDINNQGQVVGYFNAGPGSIHAFTWEPAGSRSLDTLFGGSSRANGINDSGHIVGFWDNGVVNSGSHPFLWKDGSMHALPVLGDTSIYAVTGEAVDINNNDQIIGVNVTHYFDQYNRSVYHAVLWNGGGNPTDLGNAYTPRRFNNAGIIVGTGTFNDHPHACSATGSSPSDLGTIDGYIGNSEAFDINSNGDIVGNSGTPFGVHAFLYTGGAMRDLNTLLGFGQCWTLEEATTINDSGWIAGFGKPASDPYKRHGFLLKPLTSMGPPDTSAVIIVQKPVLGQKWIVGEQDSVMWTNTGVQNVDIKYTTDHGYTIHTLALGIPAANGKYVFTVPKELSTHCTAYVSSSTDARVAGASETFKIKGYEWTRFTPDGNYEAFRPGVHGWSFANDSSTMWPSSGYVSYDHEVDSVTGMAYPQWFVQEPINAKPGDFPSWPLFVQTFGRNGCYFDSAGYGFHYRPSAIAYWRELAHKWNGSCEGLAVSSAAAFRQKATFLQQFSQFGSFNNAFDVPINITRRSVINQLWLTQYGRAQEAYDAQHEHVLLNQAWVDSLKAMFLDDNRTEGIALTMQDRHRSRGHAVTPYRIEQDRMTANYNYLRIYICDSNWPGDDSSIVQIFNYLGTDAYGWNYGADMGDLYGDGFYFEPASLYLHGTTRPTFGSSPSSKHPVIAATANGVAVYIPYGTTTLITNGVGDSIGYRDSVTFQTIQNARPIIPRSGLFQPPIGYQLPAGSYSVHLQNYADTTSACTVFADSIVYLFSRSDASPSQSDDLTIADGVRVRNNDASLKLFHLGGILVHPDHEHVIALSDLTVAQNDSIHLHADENGITIRNDGSLKTYKLNLRSVSPFADIAFGHANLTIPLNSSHIVLPVWDSLKTKAVRILVDLGNDGSIDDSLIVTNEVTGVNGSRALPIPKTFALYQNYPNPFNPTTTIRYDLPQASNVSLKVFNVLGQEVGTLVDEVKPPGEYSVTWNAGAMPSGVYYYRLFTGKFTEIKKLIVIK